MIVPLAVEESFRNDINRNVIKLYNSDKAVSWQCFNQYNANVVGETLTQSKQDIAIYSTVAGEFPALMASIAENVSIWWCHHFQLCLG